MGGEFNLDMAFVVRTVLYGLVVFGSAMATMLLLLSAAGHFAEGVQRVLADRREINFLWGLLYIAALVAGVVVLSQLGDEGFVIILVLLTGSGAFVLMGLAVVARETGRKVGRMHGGVEWSDLVAFLVGGATILLAGLVPVLGWVILIYFVANGLGASLRVISASIFNPLARGITQ